MGAYLLVGGAGFVGAHLARRLLDAGDEVTVLDACIDYERSEPALAADVRDWRRRVLLAGAEVLRGDVRDAAALRALLTARSPANVVHLGNLPLADVAAADPEVARGSIVDASLQVLEAIVGLRRRPSLTYVSSSMVYGHFAREPQDEAGPLRPLSTYGRLKLDAERRVRALARREGVTATIVRPSAVYGPGDLNGRVLQRLVEAATRGVPFALKAPASARLDFTWVEDLAAGLHAAALRASGPPRAYNVTTGAARSLGEAIAIVRGHVPELEVRDDGPDGTAPRRGSLDIARARRELGWTPQWTLEAGLKSYLAFARAGARAAA
jgi:nucleoside-diphosphate-sugar epimerase